MNCSMSNQEYDSLYPTPPPILEAPVARIARSLARRAPRFYGKYKRLKYAPLYRHKSLAEPYRLVEVDPDDIDVWGIKIYYFNLELAGEIVSGNWDCLTEQISKTGKFRSIKNHFLHDIPWDSTEIYQHLKSEIESKGEADGLKSLTELNKRYNRIDKIYNNIKVEGYKAQRDLNNESCWYDEVCVSVGRDGKFIFNGSGWHRLSIAKILELETIPVRVILRHKVWQDKKEQLTMQQHRIDDISELHPDTRHILSN